MRFDGANSAIEWRAGFPLTLSATEDAEAIAENTGLTTSAGMGAFGPLGREWQFEPGLASELQPIEVWLSCSGFQIRFQQAVPFRMLYLGNGVWRGEASEKLVPDLFSTRFETQEENHVRILDSGNHLVALSHRGTGGIREIALIHSTSLSREALIAEVQEVLDDRSLLQPAWQNVQDVRDTWQNRLPEKDSQDADLMALEHLVGATHPLSENQKVWIHEGETPLNTHMLPAALEALVPAGMSRVLSVLQALSTSPLQHTDWPILAQGLRRLPFPPEAEPLKKKLAELCAQHVTTLLQGWTPDSDGLPAWPSPEKSLTPELSGGEVTRFDLPALLVAEMEACSELSGDPHQLKPEREAMARQIIDTFWSPKRRAYLDLTSDGSHAKRITIATLFPLLWQDLPKDHVRALALLPREDPMKSPQGITQWERRDKDPSPPPVRMESQHILLPLLDRLREEEAAPISAGFHRALTQGKAEMPSLLTSALRLRLLSYERRVNPYLENLPRWVWFLEKHRASVIGTAATLLFLAPVIGVLWIASNPRLSPLEEHLMVGQAQTERSLQRYEAAEALYTLVLERSASSTRFGHYHLKRGNIRYLMNDIEEALSDYQEAIKYDEEGLLHQARWNLAQSYRALGKSEEARDAFRAYIDEYRDELTEQSDRARLAIGLLTP